MIEGTCHCGGVRFAVSEAPATLMRCNCSYCRRAGGLWAHFTTDKVSLTYDPANVLRYIWGDKTLAHVSCKICGCTTHWEGISTEAGSRMAVNFNMCDPKAIAGIRVRHFDGADSWDYLD